MILGGTATIDSLMFNTNNFQINNLKLKKRKDYYILILFHQMEIIRSVVHLRHGALVFRRPCGQKQSYQF